MNEEQVKIGFAVTAGGVLSAENWPEAKVVSQPDAIIRVSTFRIPDKLQRAISHALKVGVQAASDAE